MVVELGVIGDRIVFCRYIVECEIPKMPTEPTELLDIRKLEETLWYKFKIRLGHYRIESYGILCNDEAELADVESTLKELGIPYTVRDISPTPEQLARAREIDGKVGSRSEALDYILNGILPQRLQREREIEELKKTVNKLARQ